MTSEVTSGPVAGPDRRGIAPALTQRLGRMPLRVRLVAVVLVLLFVALAASGTASVLLVQRSLLAAIDDDLRAAAVPVASRAIEQLRGGTDRVPTNYAVRFMEPDGEDITSGPSSVGEQQMHPAIPALAITDARVQKSEPFTVLSSDGDGRWRVIAGHSANDRFTYAVAVPLFNVDKSVRQLTFWLLGLGALLMVICAVAGWYAVRRAFRPLSEIEDTAATIASGDLTRRVPEPAADDEVSSLSRSLNSMLAQIEQSFAMREASEERMRQFVADASHELRTPLAAVRGYAELYRQGAVTDPEDVSTAFRRIEDEATRMGVMVTDLLQLARLDQERTFTMTEVDLTVLAADTVHDAQALDPERPVRLLTLDGPMRPFVVRGDESRLRQVLTNLVANAINHTRAGTPIEVLLGDIGPATVQLQVRDHGTGIDPLQARQVFQRFYRADPSRKRGSGGGSGLGLAIVAAIVAAHQGRVGVQQTPGGGATFLVELPKGVAATSTANIQESLSIV